MLRRRRASLEERQHSGWRQPNEGRHEEKGADSAAQSSAKLPERRAIVSWWDLKPAACQIAWLCKRSALMWVLQQVCDRVIGCP